MPLTTLVTLLYPTLFYHVSLLYYELIDAVSFHFYYVFLRFLFSLWNGFLWMSNRKFCRWCKQYCLLRIIDMMSLVCICGLFRPKNPSSSSCIAITIFVLNSTNGIFTLYLSFSSPNNLGIIEFFLKGLITHLSIKLVECNKLFNITIDNSPSVSVRIIYLIHLPQFIAEK